MIETKKPLREIIYNKLLEAIIQGKINVGEKLIENELAHKFRVSRTPIREALLQLEREGFVSHTKHVGAVVKKISARKIQPLILFQPPSRATERSMNGAARTENPRSSNKFSRRMPKVLCRISGTSSAAPLKHHPPAARNPKPNRRASSLRQVQRQPRCIAVWILAESAPMYSTSWRVRG